MTGLYWEDSELIAKPVNWLVSVKRQYPIEHLRPIQAGKKTPNNSLLPVPFATGVWGTDNLLLPLAEGCDCVQDQSSWGKVGSEDREPLKGKHRLLKTRWGEHLWRRGGEQLSFLWRKCAAEPTGGRFDLSLALIDWGHAVLRQTRKFGVIKMWI